LLCAKIRLLIADFAVATFRLVRRLFTMVPQPRLVAAEKVQTFFIHFM